MIGLVVFRRPIAFVFSAIWQSGLLDDVPTIVSFLFHGDVLQNDVGGEERATTALWARLTKNTDWSTEPLALLARSAALTHSLAHSLRSLPRSWDSNKLDDYLF